MKKLFKTNTRHIDYRCPNCQNGWMRPTGTVLVSDPPKFPHKCIQCGYEEIFDVKYPYTVHK